MTEVLILIYNMLEIMEKRIVLFACMLLMIGNVCMSAGDFETKRPVLELRNFTSDAVEDEIDRVCDILDNDELEWIFRNCFPNTLDTTVYYSEEEDGTPDTFVITGDIPAMWLRDSGAQVWPYVQLADRDENLRKLIAGVIMRQFKSINIDPYANAFNKGATGEGHIGDKTEMKPEVFERKWEIDSQCYPVRLAYHYWKTTGDTSVFGEDWLSAAQNILTTFRQQQRKSGKGPYSFLRKTEWPNDTKPHGGFGNPVRPVGLIVSSFRPSDDATTFDFLVPSNFMAVSTLRRMADILTSVNGETELAGECLSLAEEIETALKKYAVVKHPKYGKIYAYEVDGYGSQLLMDDANVPSLLAMAYLGDVDSKDKIYRNTRRFVLSEDNPYFFKGKYAEGVGSAHTAYGRIWHMSLIMRAFTSDDDAEIKMCIEMLMSTTAGTGFMHESFNPDTPEKYSRPWFAWANTLFGELILRLVNEGKVDLLDSCRSVHNNDI
ncbi:MAG: glycoside hydrolase family 125 protein [Bacteroidales bacterium]|nr:glycoside hydrolase family 125 protein [Bacteroidales bacterium]